MKTGLVHVHTTLVGTHPKGYAKHSQRRKEVGKKKKTKKRGYVRKLDRKGRARHTQFNPVLCEEGLACPEVDEASDCISRAKLGSIRLSYVLRSKAMSVVSMITPRLGFPSGGPSQCYVPT